MGTWGGQSDRPCRRQLRHGRRRPGCFDLLAWWSVCRCAASPASMAEWHPAEPVKRRARQALRPQESPRPARPPWWLCAVARMLLRARLQAARRWGWQGIRTVATSSTPPVTNATSILPACWGGVVTRQCYCSAYAPEDTGEIHGSLLAFRCIEGSRARFASRYND